MEEHPLEQINSYIRDLLFDHDCVIIPGFGGLIGNYQPAQIDNIQHKFSPPRKKIRFNQQLTDNDGLLANYIARQENIDYDAANSRLEKHVNQARSILQQGQKWEIDKVGTFYTSNDGAIQFEPDPSANYLRDSFGLSSFHASPAKKKPAPTVQEESKPETHPPKADVSKRKPQPKSKPSVPRKKQKPAISKKVLLAAATLPFIAYFLWLSFNTELFKGEAFHYSDLNPFTDKVCADFSERTEHFDLNVTANIPEHPVKTILKNSEQNIIHVRFLEETEKSVAVSIHQPEAIAESTYVATNRKKMQFFIIGGCFEFIENAKKLVRKLKKEGFDASIIDQNKGLYRVSYSGFTSKNEAVRQLRNIQKKAQPSAWLLRK